MWNMWIFLAGGLIMTAAPSMLYLVPGRFITGFASGLATVLVPVYLGEMAPPTLRGTLGTLSQFAMVMGILISDLLVGCYYYY
jgi:SP family facilitated glucose transporter-like MFS transporter 3